MKIAVAGIGYVGLSLAVLLARHHEVTAADIDARRVEKLNHGESSYAGRYPHGHSVSEGNDGITTLFQQRFLTIGSMRDKEKYYDISYNAYLQSRIHNC